MTGTDNDSVVIDLILPEEYVDGTSCRDRLGGTSGAGVFLSQKAIGIIHACGGVPNPGYINTVSSLWYVSYSKIEHVEDDLGITVRTG